MTEIHDPLALGALRTPAALPLAGAPKSGAAGPTSESGAAFRALLERLEERTRELSEHSRTLADASGLAGAVDTARASLEDALSLGDRLLEAYREARLQGGAHTPDPETRP